MTPHEQSVPYGYCHCECGQKTLIAVRTSTSHGTVKGHPRSYCQGHNKRKIPNIEYATPFKIDGEHCRVISLGNNLWTIVNAYRYEHLMQWKWYAWFCKKTGKFYAVRSSQRKNGVPTRVLMHRLILGLDPGDKRRGDHIFSEDTLNNSDRNLRIGTASQNNQNSRRRSDNSSGFKGVYFYKDGRRKPWYAYISVDKKRISLGYFETRDEARKAYCESAKKYFGEFARFE